MIATMDLIGKRIAVTGGKGLSRPPPDRSIASGRL
jgi:hypothetical protein